jgi:hypothetical protein
MIDTELLNQQDETNIINAWRRLSIFLNPKHPRNQIQFTGSPQPGSRWKSLTRSASPASFGKSTVGKKIQQNTHSFSSRVRLTSC